MAERKRVFRGDRLSSIRKTRQFTQDELADRLELGHSQLNKYENGKSDPSPEIIVRLATELNVTADWLLGLVDEPDQRIGKLDLTAQELKLIMAFRRGDFQRLVQGRAAGMLDRAARGMHVNSKLPFFHIEDASGRMVVDRQRYERLIADLFTIVVDQRTAWDSVEVELNARGHVADDGLPFRRHFFRNVIYTPAFWGNVGVGYGSRKRGNRERREWYMIEPGHEIPPGVTMFYGVCEAVYSGVDAERLKAELRRREAIRGRMTPARTRPFSGLLVCAECGHNLRYVHVYGSGYRGYTCASRYIAQRGYRTTYDCTQRTSIPFDDIVSYFDNLIRALLAASDPVRLLHPLPTPRDTSAALERELADVEAQIVRLTARLASVPDAVAGDVLAHLERLGERRKTLHAQQIDARTTRLQADQRGAAIRSALGQIDLARFWSQPEAVIHQQLHALMDGVKVEVLDGVIVALRPKT